jgi:hypothetical protein
VELVGVKGGDPASDLLFGRLGFGGWLVRGKL